MRGNSISNYLKAIFPLIALSIGKYIGEPLLFFLGGIFVSIYLSISFRELKEFFVGPSGIKVTFAQLKSALEDLIILSARINTDLITYHNTWGGLPEQLRYNYINELETILSNIKIENESHLREVLNRIFVFYCTNEYYKILRHKYDNLLNYLRSKGVDTRELNKELNVNECPQPLSKNEWETFLKEKGVTIDANLENLLKEYEKAFNQYCIELNKIKERLENKFKVKPEVLSCSKQST